MLTRRGFAGCALCAVSGFAAVGVEAETPAAPAGIKRNILRRIDGPSAGYETILTLTDIEPGFQVPRHIHPGVESSYIAEGSAMFSIDGDEVREIKAGDAFQVPARQPHSLKNGDKPMKVISTYVLEKGQPIATPV